MKLVIGLVVALVAYETLSAWSRRAARRGGMSESEWRLYSLGKRGEE